MPDKLFSDTVVIRDHEKLFTSASIVTGDLYLLTLFVILKKY